MASAEFYELLKKLRARVRAENPTIDQLRAGFAAMAQHYPPAPDAVFERVDASGVRAEWVSLESGGERPVVLYFHGGGYCIGSAQTHRDLVSRICRAAGARALSVDYRLAPEHPHPAAVEDGVQGYRWLRKQGIPARSIVVAGDSAGGGLTLATLLALRDAGDELPAAGICISPVTDLAKEGESMRTRIDLDPMVNPASSTRYAQMYIAGGDTKTPLASPLYADLKGLPPLLILVGTSEVLFDDSTRFARKAQEAGLTCEIDVWEEMVHIWPFFAAELPEGRQAIGRMAAFISEHAAAAG